ncbi:2TM domain-containing protein [Flavobacterium segetis]|uniref:2TM domain-containing protein n=1 Tax=Flavobacterium segetis TaxID=271157 RepID=A0A1M5E5W7_9FLAO|nr:2TM domain-containing protein [Flavobacterium segetis]SHF74639.1 2TM domain-containing protein [Flavobacterium segetis]
MTTEEQLKYENATKRVKKIKGFYSHVLVYIVINIMIFIVNVQSLDKGESYVSFKNFSTAFFWGIGLAAHGLSVFGPNFVLGQNWEEKKIKELMEKERLSKYE